MKYLGLLAVLSQVSIVLPSAAGVMRSVSCVSRPACMLFLSVFPSSPYVFRIERLWTGSTSLSKSPHLSHSLWFAGEHLPHLQRNEPRPHRRQRKGGAPDGSVCSCCLLRLLPFRALCLVLLVHSAGLAVCAHPQPIEMSCDAGIRLALCGSRCFSAYAVRTARRSRCACCSNSATPLPSSGSRSTSCAKVSVDWRNAVFALCRASVTFASMLCERARCLHCGCACCLPPFAHDPAPHTLRLIELAAGMVALLRSENGESVGLVPGAVLPLNRIDVCGRVLPHLSGARSVLMLEFIVALLSPPRWSVPVPF